MNSSERDLLEEARLTLLSGDYEDAARLLADYLHVFPNNFRALHLMGNVIELEVLSGESDGDQEIVRSPSYSRALEFYKRALSIDPDNVELLADISDYFINIGSPASALIYIDRAIGLTMDNCDPIKRVEILNELTKKRAEISKVPRLDSD